MSVKPEYRWYDDRVESQKSVNEYVPDGDDDCDEFDDFNDFVDCGDYDESYGMDDCDAEETRRRSKPEHGSYDTPRDIYRYLDKHVWKQAEAKKVAALIAYKSFKMGIRENAIFVGPSGCGKTYIWQCLKEIFPDRIEIVDASRLSQDGWKGNCKWTTLLESPIFRSGRNTVLVLDEADKFLRPQFTSHGENYSHSVTAEGLKLMEGAKVDVKRGEASYRVNTENISFVFCGAFSEKAMDMAEQVKESGIGFGASYKESKAYDKPILEADLLEYGVMPEFLGRIESIVNLEAMTVDDYYRMTASSCGPVKRIEKQYKAEIRLSDEKRMELAQAAYQSGLGIRSMESRIRRLIDDALFENGNMRRFKF